MRKLKTALTGLVLLTLASPGVLNADAHDVPASAQWYFFVDLDQMRSGGPGKPVYDWLRAEVLEDVREEVGIDVGKEIDRLTSYSSSEGGAVLVVEGDISQTSKDRVMALIASGGDIDPMKSSGKAYYLFGGDENLSDDLSYESGAIKLDIDSLGDESFISMGVKDKIIVTATEAHMKTLLANNGKLPKNNGALLVLSAERPLVQAGMKAGAVGDDWDSNILRNTKEVGFLIAAAKNKLAIQAKLITEEAETATTLASVARGLISLVSFDDEMDAATIAMLKGTKVEAKGNSLSLTLAVDPELVVTTLSD